MGCNVTAVQCSQKWRNMTLQRRQKNQRQVLGLISVKAITQPWEEALEEVAPPIDMEQLANMTTPNGSATSDNPKMTQHLKRKRTEEAIMRSLNYGSPTMVNNENFLPISNAETVSPSGSSDPEEPAFKLPRSNSANRPDSHQNDEKFERIFSTLAQIQDQQARFQQDSEERARRQAERDERRIQLLAQFLALFAQATRMFLAV